MLKKRRCPPRCRGEGHWFLQSREDWENGDPDLYDKVFAAPRDGSAGILEPLVSAFLGRPVRSESRWHHIRPVHPLARWHEEPLYFVSPA